MLLYEEKNGHIDIYTWEGKEEDKRQFREEQIKKIPKKNRIYTAMTKVPYESIPLLENYTRAPFNKNILFESEINTSKEEPFYHSLELEEYQKYEKLVDLYFSGKWQDRNAVAVQYKKKLRYFLLTSWFYETLKKEKKGRICKMNGLIELPESLYLMQSLEQQDYAFLQGRNIKELLSIYHFQKQNEVSKEECRKMDLCGVTQNSYGYCLTKAKKDELFLRMIKYEKR